MIGLLQIVEGYNAAYNKGTLLGTPNREPQEYSRNIIEYKDPGRYIPIIYLLYSWASRFGVPSRVPLYKQLLSPMNLYVGYAQAWFGALPLQVVSVFTSKGFIRGAILTLKPKP